MRSAWKRKWWALLVLSSKAMPRFDGYETAATMSGSHHFIVTPTQNLS